MFDEIPPNHFLTMGLHIATFAAYPFIAPASAYTAANATTRRKVSLALYHSGLGWVCWAWVPVVIGSAPGPHFASFAQVAVAFGFWAFIVLPDKSVQVTEPPQD